MSDQVVSGLTSVIIVTFNSSATIDRCLRSVLDSGDQLEVVVVDNASSDDTRATLAATAEQDARITLEFNGENEGFSRAVNRGMSLARGDAFLLLNPDTVVPSGFASRLRAHLSAPGPGDVAAVGPLSDYVAGLQQVRAHVEAAELSSLDVAGVDGLVASRFAGQNMETSLLIGLCLLIPRATVERIGPLDPALFLGNDDLDYSWRARLSGMRLLVARDVFVHHAGQVSFKTLPEGAAERLVRHSTDVLARKLLDYYGWGRVPTGMDLWGIDWFEPTMNIWRSDVAQVEASPDWQDGVSLREAVAAFAARYTRDDAAVLTLHVPPDMGLERAFQRLDATTRVVCTDPALAPEIRLTLDSAPSRPSDGAGPPERPAPSARYDTVPELGDPGSAQAQQFRTVPEGATVLDIGCSTGAMARALTERKNCNVVGLELDPESARVARERGVAVVEGAADDADARQAALQLSGAAAFDAILFGDVLEHVPDPDSTLIGCLDVLAPGGSVIASIPNVAHGSIRLELMMGRFEYRDTGLLDRTHLQLFTGERIRRMVASAGLELVALMTCHVAIEGAEGRAMPGSVPQEFVRFLERDPEATIYQYVAHAVKPA